MLKTKSRLLTPEQLKEHIIPNLEVRHTRTSPVMLIGQPRSGTTICARMLRKYLKVNFGPESQFIIRMHKQLNRYGDLKKEANTRNLIRSISRERCFQRNQFGFEINEDAIIQKLREYSYPEIVDQIFRQFAAHNGMIRWGDKTPEYLHDLPPLYWLFPEAQFIHIVRDGRDVALSNYDVHFGAKNAVVAAQNWHYQAGLVKDFTNCIPVKAGGFMELRYEDFLSEPQVVFAQLIDFLAIDDTDGKLLRYIEDNIQQDLKAGNFQKWKKRFTPREIIDYERVAGNALRAYGYETQNRSNRPLSRLESIYWNADHLRIKVLQSGYWKDTFYRAKLQLRRLGFFRGKNRHQNRDTGDRQSNSGSL